MGIAENPKRKSPAGASRRKAAVVASCAALVAAVAAGAWRYWPAKPPPPTAAPEKVVEYAASEKFAELPQEKKNTYVAEMMKDPLKFIDAARASGMSEETRRSAMRNLFLSQMQVRVDGYFKLPPGPQRTKYIDQQIDEMEKYRTMFQARAQDRQNQAAAQGGGATTSSPGGSSAGSGGTSAAQGAPTAGGGAGQGQGGGMGLGRLFGGGGQGSAHGGLGGGHEAMGSPNPAERMKSMIENIPPESRARFAEFFNAVLDRRKERGMPDLGSPH